MQDQSQQCEYKEFIDYLKKKFPLLDPDIDSEDCKDDDNVIYQEGRKIYRRVEERDI